MYIYYTSINLSLYSDTVDTLESELVNLSASIDNIKVKIFQSIYPFIYSSFYISIYPFTYPITYSFINLYIYLSFYIFVHLRI